MFKKKLLSRLLPALMLIVAYPVSKTHAAGSGTFYQIKIYHFKTLEQGEVIEKYLKDVFVPYVHKMNSSKLGVFKTLDADTTDRRIFVLIPFKSWKGMDRFNDMVLSADSAGKSNAYTNAGYKTPPYTRIETILLNSFYKMPGTDVPELTAPKSERVYELRSYESATEGYFVNKRKMFNQGDEVGLFKRLGFNAVFYASVIAGSHMPNLMYMTTFNNKQDRDKHWEAFSADPQWKKLSGMPEYQNNVSKADIVFMHPTAYSDF